MGEKGQKNPTAWLFLALKPKAMYVSIAKGTPVAKTDVSILVRNLEWVFFFIVDDHRIRFIFE